MRKEKSVVRTAPALTTTKKEQNKRDRNSGCDAEKLQPYAVVLMSARNEKVDLISACCCRSFGVTALTPVRARANSHASYRAHGGAAYDLAAAPAMSVCYF
jgi:hypothetical protein